MKKKLILKNDSYITQQIKAKQATKQHTHTTNQSNKQTKWKKKQDNNKDNQGNPLWIKN